MIFDNFLSRLKNISIDEAEEGLAAPGKQKDAALSPTLQVRVSVCCVYTTVFAVMTTLYRPAV